MKVRCLFILGSKNHLLHSSLTEMFAASLGSGTFTEVSVDFPKQSRNTVRNQNYLKHPIQVLIYFRMLVDFICQNSLDFFLSVLPYLKLNLFFQILTIHLKLGT